MYIKVFSRNFYKALFHFTCLFTPMSEFDVLIKKCSGLYLTYIFVVPGYYYCQIIILLLLDSIIKIKRRRKILQQLILF